jgi:L-amino acid N-acyltransferase YncA
MASVGYDIAPAAREDLSAILDLQEQNLRERGGALSVRFSRNWFEAVLGDMPIVVARKGGVLVGYLVSSSKAAQSHLPVVQAMLRAYPGASNAYVYGPICVAGSERGEGLPGLLMSALRLRLAGREGVTFIRRDNARSLRAHAKIGMRVVAEFADGDASFVVIAHSG